MRVRVGGAWGFAAVRGTDRRDAEAALERALAIAEAQPSVPDGDPACAGASGPWRVGEPGRARPLRGPARGEARGAARSGRRAAHRAGREPHARALLGAFGPRRSSPAPRAPSASSAITECGGGISAVAVEGSDSQIRSYPASHGGHVAQAGYEHFLAAGAAGARSAGVVGGRGAAARAGLPARPHDAHPRGRAARAPGARVGRPRRRARPGARPRGLVRGHELRAGGRDRLAALRLRAGERDRGRHEPRRARQLPLGRRGRGGAPRADRAGRRARAAFCPRARPRRRSGSSARAAACARRASPASRSCG